MSKNMTQVLKENNFYTIFDILDWIDKKIDKLNNDKEIQSHYLHIKNEIMSESVRIMKNEDNPNDIVAC